MGKASWAHLTRRSTPVLSVYEGEKLADWRCGLSKEEKRLEGHCRSATSTVRIPAPRYIRGQLTRPSLDSQAYFHGLLPTLFAGS